MLTRSRRDSVPRLEETLDVLTLVVSQHYRMCAHRISCSCRIHDTTTRVSCLWASSLRECHESLAEEGKSPRVEFSPPCPVGSLCHTIVAIDRPYLTFQQKKYEDEEGPGPGRWPPVHRVCSTDGRSPNGTRLQANDLQSTWRRS